VKVAPLLAAVLVAVLQVAALGCRTPGDGRALAPDDPRPEALLRGLYRTADARKGLRGQARFSLDAPDLRFRRPQRMALQRPARVRVEVLAFLGQVAAVLAIDGSEYQFLDNSTLALQEGRVTPDLLWRVARIDLSAVEVVEIVLGAPLPAAGLSRGPAWQGPEGQIAIDFRDDDGRTRQRFQFDPEGRLEQIRSVDAAGESIWTVDYGDYRPVGAGAGAFAHQIELSFPRVEARSKFSFTAVELNPELSDTLFRLAPIR
jgi:hypothetical protein